MKLSYFLGNFFGKLTKKRPRLVIIGAPLVFGTVVFYNMLTYKQIDSTPQPNVAQTPTPLDCIKDETKILAFVNAKALPNDDDLRVLKTCATETKKTTYTAKVNEAERLIKIKADADIKQLLKDEKIAAQEKIRAAKYKKTQGVHVGMTPEDVLASSWGKPNHINTTTTVNSVREQWVYGLRNYLYFRDGILQTIQN